MKTPKALLNATLALVIGFSTLPVHAQAVVTRDPISQTLADLGFLRRSNVLTELGTGTAGLGLAVGTLGLLAEKAAWKSATPRAVQLAAKWGLGAFVLGVGGVIVGILIDSFDRRARAATLDDFYLTPQGFKEFVAMEPEHQRQVLERHPRLVELVADVMAAVRDQSQLEAHAVAE